MNQLIINIPKDGIFTEVSLASSYAGAKAGDDENAFARVSTVEEDSELLERFWYDTCGEVADRLKSFTVDSEFTGLGFSITLELSAAYDTAMTPSVEREIFSSIATGVTSRWFRFTKPEISEEWSQRSSELLSRVFAKLCHRKAPRRSK